MVCQFCDSPLTDPRAKVCCGDHECRKAYMRQREKARKLAKKRATVPENRTCEGCGGPIPFEARADARHCSRPCIELRRSKNKERAEWSAAYQARRTQLTRKWRKANPAAVAAAKAARRAVENADRAQVTERDWQRLVNRFGGCCAYCGTKTALTVDHVVPLSRGGRHAIGNILPACQSCNSAKHARLLVEWRTPGHALVRS